MSKPENSADLLNPIDDISVPPAPSLPDEGWGAEEDEDPSGGFAVGHTTVDPTLLARLAALDAKDLSKKSPGKPAPPKASAPKPAPPAAPPEPEPPAEHTINLDASEFFAALEAEEAAEAAAAEGGAEATQAISMPDELLPERTQALEPPPMPAPAPAPPPSSLLEDDSPDYGDLPAEKTQLFTPAMDDEPTRAKLKVIQGGGQQKEYLLARDSVTLGRGTNNDILVPDIAISRQHSEILRTSDGNFRLRDMGSGNGTKLNGVRVLDSDLFGGDRIEIGSTILEFVLTGPGASRSPGERKINLHPSEASSAPSASMPPGGASRRSTGRNDAVPPPPAAPIPNYAAQGAGNSTITSFAVQPIEAPAARGGNNGLIIGLIAAFGIAFLGIAAVLGFKIWSDAQARTGEATTAAAKPAKDYFFEGVAAVKEHQWDKAEESFTLAVDLAKEERDFQTRKDAELQLERVRAEKTSETNLARGKTLLERGDHLDAIAKLETIKSSSFFYKEARENIDTAKNKHAAKLTQEAQEDFDAKRFDEADKKITLALTTLPDFEKAKALRTSIDELPTEEYTPPPKNVAAAARTPRDPDASQNNDRNTDKAVGKATDKAVDKAVEKPDDKNAVANSATKKPSGGTDLVPGLTMYRSKRFGEAVAYFKKIAEGDTGFNGKKAGELATDVASFEQNFNQGSSAFQGNDWPTSTRLLTTARRLDLKISGTGFHRAPIDEMLAEAHYQQGRAAFNGQNLGRAGSHAKLALQYKPAHPGNRELLNELEGKAKAMYIDAYSKKGSDSKTAKNIATAIVGMLPESSDTHQKAKKLLTEL